MKKKTFTEVKTEINELQEKTSMHKTKTEYF